MRCSIRVQESFDGEEARAAVAERARRVRSMLPAEARPSARASVYVGRGGEEPIQVFARLRAGAVDVCARGSGETLVAAIDSAFGEVERSLVRIDCGERELRASEGGRALEERLSARGEERGIPGDEAGRRLQALAPHVPRLLRYVRRELRMRTLNGDLHPGELDARDIVENTLLQAIESYEERPLAQATSGWLIGLASEQIRREVERLASERETVVHLEDDVPDIPPEREVVTLGDEILDFYQPDEDLHVEDVLAALGVPAPQDEEERAALHDAVFDALAALPAEWRSAFWVHRIEGLSEEDAAGALSMKPADVRSGSERAADYLKARVAERRRS